MQNSRIRVEQANCLLSIALALVTGATASSPCHAERPPNVILIMADDLGYAELGCYGQQKIETPNIDRLADEGMRFTQFYSGAPVCAPARCILMTGKHGGHAHVRGNLSVGTWESFHGQTPLPSGSTTIATMMKQAGYATGAFGKWGLGQVGSSGDPLKLGFDRFFGYNCQVHAHNLYPRFLVEDSGQRTLEGNDRTNTGMHFAPQVIANEALKFVRQHSNQPFFLYYPTVLPHLPLQAPDEEVAHYRGRWPEVAYEAKPDMPYPYLSHPTPRSCYAAMISFHDKQVGRLMTLLKELDLDDNTVVLYTSDNGTSHVKEQVAYEFFESVGPLRGLKGSVYEGGIRVPMIARWPGNIRKGTTTDHPSVHYDLFATIADLVKSSSPENDGVSFLPAMLGQTEAQEKHEYLFWDFAGYGGQLAVLRGNWKGVKQSLKNDANAPLQLFDLKQDPSESRDLAKQHPEIAAELNQLMLEARTRPDIEAFRFGQYTQ